MKPLIIHIGFDPDAENPNENYGWTLIPFRADLIGSQKQDLWLRRNEGGYCFPADIGIAAKLRAGTAFFATHYDSSGRWTVLHESNAGCWYDNFNHDGIVVWEANVKDLAKMNYEERKVSAEWHLKTYSTWARGEFVGWTVSNCKSEFIDSLWGIETMEYAMQSCKESHPDHAYFAFDEFTADNTNMTIWDENDEDSWAQAVGLVAGAPSWMIHDRFLDEDLETEAARFRELHMSEVPDEEVLSP